MEIRYWPQTRATDSREGSLKDFLSNLKLNKHPDLWALVRRTMENAEKPHGLDTLREKGWISKLQKLKEPIWEFRIPPKKRRGGVVRIYFCHETDKDCIICLSAEFKKRVGASNQKIDSAQKRYREYMDEKARKDRSG